MIIRIHPRGLKRSYPPLSQVGNTPFLLLREPPVHPCEAKRRYLLIPQVSRYRFAKQSHRTYFCPQIPLLMLWLGTLASAGSLQQNLWISGCYLPALIYLRCWINVDIDPTSHPCLVFSRRAMVV